MGKLAHTRTVAAVEAGTRSPSSVSPGDEGTTVTILLVPVIWVVPPPYINQNFKPTVALTFSEN